jgi:hypothetical protein
MFEPYLLSLQKSLEFYLSALSALQHQQVNNQFAENLLTGTLWASPLTIANAVQSIFGNMSDNKIAEVLSEVNVLTCKLTVDTKMTTPHKTVVTNFQPSEKSEKTKKNKHSVVVVCGE